MGKTSLVTELDGGEDARSKDRRIGSTIGRYLLEEQIGDGAMGVVYRARHVRLDHRVALKVLAPHVFRDGEFKEERRHACRHLMRATWEAGGRGCRSRMPARSPGSRAGRFTIRNGVAGAPQPREDGGDAGFPRRPVPGPQPRRPEPFSRALPSRPPSFENGGRYMASRRGRAAELWSGGGLR